MTVCEKYLNQFKEVTPAWLLAYKPGCPLDVEEIFNSQLLYWTECFWGDAGSPIRLLNHAQAVHVFIYASCDYLHDWCERSYDLKGYDIIDRREIDMDDIAPAVESFYHPVVENHSLGKCELFVYERKADFSDDLGAQRIALLDIGGDTIDLFQRLFCSRPMRRAPFFMGVGDGNIGKTPFGAKYRDSGIAKGGIPLNDKEHRYKRVMELMGRRANKFPRFFYAMGPFTTPWTGYELVDVKSQPCHAPRHYELESGQLYELKTAIAPCDYGDADAIGVDALPEFRSSPWFCNDHWAEDRENFFSRIQKRDFELLIMNGRMDCLRYDENAECNLKDLLKGRRFCWNHESGSDFRDILYLTKTRPFIWEPKHEYKTYRESPCDIEVFVHTHIRAGEQTAAVYALRPGEKLGILLQHRLVHVHDHRGIPGGNLGTADAESRCFYCQTDGHSRWVRSRGTCADVRDWEWLIANGVWPCDEYYSAVLLFEGVAHFGRVSIVNATLFSRQCGHVRVLLIGVYAHLEEFADFILRNELKPEAFVQVDDEVNLNDLEPARRVGAQYIYSRLGGKGESMPDYDNIGYIPFSQWRGEMYCWKRKV